MGPKSTSLFYFYWGKVNSKKVRVMLPAEKRKRKVKLPKANYVLLQEVVLVYCSSVKSKTNTNHKTKHVSTSDLSSCYVSWVKQSFSLYMLTFTIVQQ